MLRRIYAGWLSLVAVLIVVQLYLAGYAVFAFNGLKSFDGHLVFGDVIGIAILISLGLAFAARVTGRMRTFNGVLLCLLFIQFLGAPIAWQVISGFTCVI